MRDVHDDIAHPSDPTPRAAIWVVAIASFVALIAGAVLALGWILGIESLQSVAPGLATMKANTALGFLLSAAALFALIPNRARPTLARVLAVAVAGLGLITVAQDIFDLSLGIDQLIAADPGTDPTVAAPGRMSSATAGSFVVFALAILGAVSRRSSLISAGQVAAVVLVAIALTAITGYLYGVKSLYLVLPFSTMALHTAFLFFLLGLGVLGAHPRAAIAGLFTDRSLGGVLARELLPAIVVVCLTLGLFRVWGERAGLYDSPFGTALYTVTQIFLIVALVAAYAKFIGHTDRKRAEARADERLAHERLKVTLEAIGDAVIATGPSGLITFFNPAAARLTGYDPDQAIGQFVTDVFKVVDRETETPLDSPVVRVSHRDPHEVREDAVLISRNGDRIRIADTLSPIRTSDGKSAGIVIVFRNTDPQRPASTTTKPNNSNHASAG